MRRALQGLPVFPLLAVLVLPWALLWPLPRIFASALLTSPLSEGATHLWTWWAALRERQIFTVHTTLLNYPDGLQFQLIDPMHVVPYALGSLLGPAAGFNAVLVWGLVIGGLGGLLLAREAGADTGGQLLGVAMGASAPTLLAVATDGIAEGLGAGWVGVQLALLWSFRRGASPGRVLALGLAIAAGALSGPYNAVWMAILDLPLGLWLLRRTRAPLASAVLALAICAPYLWAILQRDPNMPGGESREGLGQALVVEPWRAAGERGVDLLDLFVPAPLTGAFSDLPHTAYLGVVSLFLAGLGAARMRRERRPGALAWPWLLGAAVFATLALGPWLSIGGHFPTVGGKALVAPAGLLALWTPLGRLSRWYRAGAVAVLLLVPLAVRAMRGRWAWLAAGLVLLDARFLAPLPLAFETYPLQAAPALAGIEGPIAELPPIHPMFMADQPADLNLLLQTLHGQPTNGTIHSIRGLATNSDALRTLRRVATGEARSGDSAVEATQALEQHGYRWLAVYRGFFPQAGIEGLSAQLGAPSSEDDRVVVYLLSSAPR